MRFDQKGQYIVEYAILVVLITAALVAMSTYVYRSVQSTQQVIQEEYDYTFGEGR